MSVGISESDGDLDEETTLVLPMYCDHVHLATVHMSSCSGECQRGNA